MTAQIYAIRHGETEWNSLGRQQGHLDSPLTPNGVRQANLLAGGLLPKRIEILYSSDLGRALQTAEIIAKTLSLNVCTDSRLRERHLGILQGLTMQQFEELYPAEYELFSSNDPDYILPGGESARQCFERCVAYAEGLATENNGKNILIVGHGGVLKSFFHKTIGTSLRMPRRFSLFNGSINSFRVSNGHWMLDTWGEIAHLHNGQALDDF